MDKRDTRVYKKLKRRKFTREYTPIPPIDNLTSLIEIAQSNIRYSNIDIDVLWNILPELQELQELIGMSKLKETLFRLQRLPQRITSRKLPSGTFEIFVLKNTLR